MIIIPSLDIQNGISKYAYKGSNDPMIIADQLKHQGFHHIMITDLDGVFSGEFVHIDLIQKFKALGFQVIAGGGIRSKSSAETLINAGADRLIIGTVAIKDQELLMDLIETYSEQLYVAIDTYETSVYIEGWLEDSDVDVEEFINSMSLLGVKRLVHTEIDQANRFNLCNDGVFYSMAESYNIHITPAIDINQHASILELEACGYSDLILGGELDMINLNEYMQLHL